MIDYQHLRQLAQNATPGPWYVTDLRDRPDGNRDCIWVDSRTDAEGHPAYQTVADMDEDEGLRIVWGLPDAEFIAAADPQTVLALLDRIAELEARK